MSQLITSKQVGKIMVDLRLDMECTITHLLNLIPTKSVTFQQYFIEDGGRNLCKGIYFNEDGLCTAIREYLFDTAFIEDTDGDRTLGSLSLSTLEMILAYTEEISIQYRKNNP